MANCASLQVIDRLKKYITENGWLEKAQKKNSDFVNTIEALTAEDITFGNQPTFVCGYLSGNSTGSGEQTYGDTINMRTVSIDFTTDEMLFIARENKADTETCKKAFQYGFSYGYLKIHTMSETSELAANRGKYVCEQSLNDLNYFSKQAVRLKRHQFHPTTEPFRVPIWPIYANLKKANGKEKKLFIGYWYTKNNTDYIDLSIDVPMTPKQKLITFGVVAGIILLVIAILFWFF